MRFAPRSAVLRWCLGDLCWLYDDAGVVHNTEKEGDVATRDSYGDQAAMRICKILCARGRKRVLRCKGKRVHALSSLLHGALCCRHGVALEAGAAGDSTGDGTAFRCRFGCCGETATSQTSTSPPPCDTAKDSVSTCPPRTVSRNTRAASSGLCAKTSNVRLTSKSADIRVFLRG